MAGKTKTVLLTIEQADWVDASELNFSKFVRNYVQKAIDREACNEEKKE